MITLGAEERSRASWAVGGASPAIGVSQLHRRSGRGTLGDLGRTGGGTTGRDGPERPFGELGSFGNETHGVRQWAGGGPEAGGSDTGADESDFRPEACQRRRGSGWSPR